MKKKSIYKGGHNLIKKLKIYILNYIVRIRVHEVQIENFVDCQIFNFFFQRRKQ